MFDIAPTELLIVALVALVVIGPKDLPKVMRTVGHWVGRARGMARHFRSGIDTMIREAELEEMEKKWKAENERIMRDYPMLPPHDDAHPQPLPPASAEADQHLPPASADADQQHLPPASADAPPAPDRRELP